jgi:hypothetical protein
MATEPPQPSRSAKDAVEFSVLATTVVAIILGFLILGGDPQLRVQVVTVLTVALVVVAFAYARGFERASVAMRRWKQKIAISHNPDLVRRLETLVQQAGETFGSPGKMYSFPNAANVLLSVVQQPERTPATLAATAKVEELAQLWGTMAGDWHNTTSEVTRLCSGPAKEDTQSFVDAMTLTGSLLKLVYWAVYRLVTVVGQIGGDGRVVLAPKQHERDRWTNFREKANVILADYDTLAREANAALGLALTPLDERITDPW